MLQRYGYLEKIHTHEGRGVRVLKANDAGLRGIGGVVLEHLPEKGPFLVVGNHSGGQSPPDLPILLTAWWRERGVDEVRARERLLGRLHRGAKGRQRVMSQVEAAWVGVTEKDRVSAAVAVLLAIEGRTLDPVASAATARESARVVLPVPPFWAIIARVCI